MKKILSSVQTSNLQWYIHNFRLRKLSNFLKHRNLYERFNLLVYFVCIFIFILLQFSHTCNLTSVLLKKIFMYDLLFYILFIIYLYIYLLFIYSIKMY